MFEVRHIPFLVLYGVLMGSWGNLHMLITMITNLLKYRGYQIRSCLYVPGAAELFY